MAADSQVIERLAEQVEQRYQELNEQLADPETMADRGALHRGRAQPPPVGGGAQDRRGVPARRERRRRRRGTAGGRRRLHGGGRAARVPGDGRDLARGYGGARRAAAARNGGAGSQRRQERDRRDPGRHRGRRGGAVRGRPLPDADQVRRAARVQDRGDRPEPIAVGRLQGDHLRDQGRRRLQRLQVRGRSAPRAARPPDRVAGPDPHLDRDGRGAAGGRGGRGPDRPQRPPDGRVPLVGPRRAVGEHDRLRGPHHAQADRPRGLDAGREVPASEPGARDAGTARAPVRARAARAAGRAGGRPQGAGGKRRALGEGPHLQLSRRAASPTTGSSSRRTTSRACSRGISTSSRTPWLPTSDGSSSRPRRPPSRRRRDALQAGSSIRDALSAATEALEAAGCDTPRLDAELLLARAAGVDRAALHAKLRAASWSRRRHASSRELVRRRVRREPVAQILGTAHFRELELRVDHRVLVPRPGDRAAGGDGRGRPARARRRHRQRGDRARDRAGALGCG